MDKQNASSTNRPLTASAGNRGVVVITVPGNHKVPTPAPNGMSNQGVATLIVMCCVLLIIMMFCCLAAPGIRDLCKRYVFRQCVIDDPEVHNVWNRRYGVEPDHKIVSEKEQRRSSRSSEHRQSRRHSNHRRPL